MQRNLSPIAGRKKQTSVTVLTCCLDQETTNQPEDGNNFFYNKLKCKVEMFIHELGCGATEDKKQI